MSATPSSFTIAVHEAAHAVMAYRLGGWVTWDGKLFANQHEGFAEISMVPGNETKALICLAGAIAEVLYLGPPYDGGSSVDFGRVAALAHSCPNPEVAVDDWVRSAFKILQEPEVEHAVLCLAAELQSEETMSRQQVEHAIAPAIREWRANCVRSHNSVTASETQIEKTLKTQEIHALGGGSNIRRPD